MHGARSLFGPDLLPPILALALLLLAAPARAQLDPVAQVRSAHFDWMQDEGTYTCFPGSGCTPVNATHTEDEDDDSAPDFGAWSASLGGIVSIDSTALGSTGFSASASHAGTGGAYFAPTGEPLEFYAYQLFTNSNAHLSYTFDVTEPTPYRLFGELATSGAGFLGSMLARVRLTGPGGAELLAVELIDDDQCQDPACLVLGPEDFDMSGILMPGSHTVVADLQGSGESLISISTGVYAANAYDGEFQVTLTTAVAAPGLGGAGLVALAVALAGCGRRRLG